MAEFENRKQYFAQYPELDWSAIDNVRRQRSIAEQERLQSQKGYKGGKGGHHRDEPGKGGKRSRTPPRTDFDYGDEELVFQLGERFFYKTLSFTSKTHAVELQIKAATFTTHARSCMHIDLTR